MGMLFCLQHLGYSMSCCAPAEPATTLLQSALPELAHSLFWKRRTSRPLGGKQGKGMAMQDSSELCTCKSGTPPSGYANKLAIQSRDRSRGHSNASLGRMGTCACTACMQNCPMLHTTKSTMAFYRVHLSPATTHAISHMYTSLSGIVQNHDIWNMHKEQCIKVHMTAMHHHREAHVAELHQHMHL